MAIQTARRSDGALYIDGEYCQSVTQRTAPVHEKATGAEIGSAAEAGPEDVSDAVAAAVRAGAGWARRSWQGRAELLRAAAQALERRAEEFIDVLIRETGAVRRKAEGEVRAAVTRLHQSAALAERPTGELLADAKPGKLTMLQRVPLGVVAVITPWNFPLVLALRAVGPGLALGNTIVLKPAPLTPIAGGQLLMEVFDEVGLPPGVVNLVTGGGKDVGQPLAAHPDVAMIHFTGSVEVGRLMAQIAAADFKRVQLELGGDNALAVLDDADVAAASRCGSWSAFDYQGQTCITVGRHIVMRPLAEAYTEAVVQRARSIKVGDPMDAGVDLGPLISDVQRDRVHRIVEDSVRMGARVLEGGAYDGLFYRPTVLDQVTPDMPAFTEEIFGPVAPITVAESEEEALALTNRAQALVNAVYTGDLMRGLAFAERVRCGMVHVNDAGPRPTGETDLEEFTQLKWVGVQRTPLTYPL